MISYLVCVMGNIFEKLLIMLHAFCPRGMFLFKATEKMSEMIKTIA